MLLTYVTSRRYFKDSNTIFRSSSRKFPFRMTCRVYSRTSRATWSLCGARVLPSDINDWTTLLFRTMWRYDSGVVSRWNCLDIDLISEKGLCGYFWASISSSTSSRISAESFARDTTGLCEIGSGIRSIVANCSATDRY